MSPKHDLSDLDSKVILAFLDWLNDKVHEIDLIKGTAAVDGIVIFKKNETVKANVIRLFDIWLKENEINKKGKKQ